MSQDLLGKGWSYPVKPERRGNIDMSSDEADIKESIRIILGTNKGERVMRPEFGCNLQDYVYSDITSTTLGRIEDDVSDALKRWEPRIAVQSVDAFTPESEPNKIIIELEYTIRKINKSGDMTYTFNTTESDG